MHEASQILEPIIFKANLEIGAKPLTIANTIDLLHQYRIQCSLNSGLDLIAVAKDPGLGFYLNQVAIRPQTAMSTATGQIVGQSRISRYLNDSRGSTRTVVTFEFKNMADQLLVDGEALYSVVNTRTGKPALFLEHMWKHFAHGNFKSEMTTNQKLKLFDVKSDTPLTFSNSYETQSQDIDMYKHVGSGSYLRYVDQLILDSGLALKGKNFEKYEIQYLSSLTGVGTKFIGRIGSDGIGNLSITLSKPESAPFLTGKIS